MIPSESIRIALRALRLNALRSVLTVLGIVIGVAAVITMAAVGNGARLQVAEQMRSLGSNLLIVLPGSLSDGRVRLGSGTRPSLTEDDAETMRREVTSLIAVAPSVVGSATLVRGNNNWFTVVEGIVPDFFMAREWNIALGRPFSLIDTKVAAKVAIIGATVAEKLFGMSDPLDQIIRLGEVPLRVIGVLGPRGTSSSGRNEDDVILVPLSTAKMRLKGLLYETNRRAVKYIVAKVVDEVRMAQAEKDIRSLLRQRHQLLPNSPDDFTVHNPIMLLAAKEKNIRALSLLLAAVASVSLIVGGISIMNIMLVSVTERTREIGLRLAIGARRRDIRNQFLLEAMTLSLLGGIAGIVIGIAVGAAIAEISGWPILISPGAILFAFGFAAAVGVFFGLYPANKASRLDPIETLRFE